jgi:hypothetical protein
LDKIKNDLDFRQRLSDYVACECLSQHDSNWMYIDYSDFTANHVSLERLIEADHVTKLIKWSLRSHKGTHTYRVIAHLGVQRIYKLLIRYANSTYILKFVDVVVIGSIDMCGDRIDNVGGCVGQTCVVGGLGGGCCMLKKGG